MNADGWRTLADLTAELTQRDFTYRGLERQRNVVFAAFGVLAESRHHSAANHFIATEIRVSGGGNRCLGRGNRVNL
jgi:hypothetical protein